jgi:hypothetical protein
MTNKRSCQSDWVIYTDDEDGSSILWSGSGGDEDLGIQKGWKYLGADYKEAGLSGVADA